MRAIVRKSKVPAGTPAFSSSLSNSGGLLRPGVRAAFSSRLSKSGGLLRPASALPTFSFLAFLRPAAQKFPLDHVTRFQDEAKHSVQSTAQIVMALATQQ